MRGKLDDAKLRARFLKAYARTNNITRAALAVGLSGPLVMTYRYKHPEFRAACDAAVAGVGCKRAAQVNWTPARRQTFITALGMHGSIERAAASLGMPADSAYALRRRDAQFAADWADARDRALDRIEDRLFEAAMNGFVSTTEKDGSVTTRRSQQAGAMFKLLEGRRRAGRSNRMLELTPAVLAAARDRFEAALRRAAETGELPPPALVTLPPPTVSAYREAPAASGR